MIIFSLKDYFFERKEFEISLYTKVYPIVFAISTSTRAMANVFIILRDEKKSPDINKRRQIPMSLLKEIKGKTSECDKNLMVS